MSNKAKNYLNTIGRIYDNFDSIVITNADGIIEYAKIIDENKKIVVNHDYTGKSLFEVYPELDRNESTIQQVLRTGKPVVDVFQSLKDFQGNKMEFYCSTYPIMLNGQVIGAIDGSYYIGKSPRSDSLKSRSNNQNGSEDLYTCDDIITKDPAMLEIKNRIAKFAAGDVPILIIGDTGTGKELVAQSIHVNSPRSDKPFISQNCAAIPEGLLESTLFGTVRGSFTGAETRKGLFELADGGTLFLDELNSMDTSLQSKILKAIEEQKIRRIGDEKERNINVRIVSAINMSPVRAITQDLLRDDLYFRIGAVQLVLPPLRDREGDIALLAEHFIDELNEEYGKSVQGFSDIAYNFLLEYSWPGNVRELRNAIEYAVNVSEDETITMEDLPDSLMLRAKETMSSVVPDVCAIYDKNKSLAQCVEEFEESLIRHAISHSKSKAEAAEKLQISRQSLNYKLQKYGIKSF